jgi:hypothetical protein
MMSVVAITEPVKGMKVKGWITSTLTDERDVVYYGMFDTIEEATKWADSLLPSTIEPVYALSHNRL